MKIDIEPSVGHLDFIGPTNESITASSSASSIHSNSSSQILTGNIMIKLTKATKFKTMTVKLKGHSRVSHYVKITDKSPQYNIGSPLLPKLKTKLISKSAVFPAGEHIIPWELEIPNIYPRSFSATKRGTIQYKVELKISMGFQNSMTADRPIVIRRHMISSQDSATLVRTNLYESKTTDRFHYELEAPSIICIEQGYLPILINYNTPVKFIYSQFIQTEVYRCRNITRSEADMGINMASKKTGIIASSRSSEDGGGEGVYKLVKRIQPITLHTIDPEDGDDHIPLLLSHDLERHRLALTPGLESPLVVIQHRVELTFNFGQVHDEFRVQIPVIVSSLPGSFPASSAAPKVPSTTEEKQKYLIETKLHRSPLSVDILDTAPNKISNGSGTSNKSTIMEDSNFSFTTSIKDSFIGGLLDDDKKSVKKAVSDQNLQYTRKTLDDARSVTTTPPPPPPSKSTSKPNTIDTQLANRLEASMSMKSPYTPNTAPLNTSTSTSAEGFAGLLPPPRRIRKKEQQHSTIGMTLSRSSSTTTTHSSRNIAAPTTISSAIPLPPLPTYNTNDYNSGGESRPTSPNSISYVPTAGYSLSSSSDSINTTPPPLSPPPPPPRTSTVIRKRSNNTATCPEDYSTSVTSHYFGAELPPIPPPMTRQRLPSLPMENSLVEGEGVDKEENRKTRMYYEDESDDEEGGYYDDDMDYSNFYLINQRVVPE